MRGEAQVEIHTPDFRGDPQNAEANAGFHLGEARGGGPEAGQEDVRVVPFLIPFIALSTFQGASQGNYMYALIIFISYQSINKTFLIFPKSILFCYT